MILVIDDEPDVLEILKDKLKEIGDEQVICCEHLDNALTIIETVPGLTKIYVDVYLPGVDGTDSILEVARTVERLALNPKPMIFSMSGDTRKTIKDQSIANGARTFLDKSQLIVSQHALRDSYYLEERRSRDRDRENDLKDRIAKLETNLWEINTNLSNLQGQQSNDDRRISEMQTQVNSNTNKLKPITDTMEFINKFPFKLKGFLGFCGLLITIGSSFFTSLGLADKVLDYIYHQMPERPVKSSTKTP